MRIAPSSSLNQEHFAAAVLAIDTEISEYPAPSGDRAVISLGVAHAVLPFLIIKGHLSDNTVVLLSGRRALDRGVHISRIFHSKKMING